jgi:hypothetical protein
MADPREKKTNQSEDQGKGEATGVELSGKSKCNTGEGLDRAECESGC